MQNQKQKLHLTQTSASAHTARRVLGLLLAGGALALAVPAQAQNYTPNSTIYGEVGAAAHGTHSATIGVTWPFELDRPLWGGRLTGHWDAFVSQWRYESKATAGRTSEDLTHLALVPTFRLRFDEGRSPWFAEGGIGISLMDARYITPTKEFSTRFNFADRIAIGRSFGLRGEHEVALQLQHVSNAGIKEPNPGENFLQLRYGVAF